MDMIDDNDDDDDHHVTQDCILLLYWFWWVLHCEIVLNIQMNSWLYKNLAYY